MSRRADTDTAAEGGAEITAAPPPGEEPEVEVRVEVDAEPAPAAADAAAPPPTREAELEARAASLEAQLEMAQERARETFGKLKEEHDRHLRAVADLENYRKRAAREREDLQRFGSERLLKELLPVMDNLDRALAAAPGEGPLANGVRLVRRIFEDALAKHGVEVFSAVGKPFDPRLHEALAQLDDPQAEPGTVVAEQARGFLLHGRLLRPAMVAVAAPRQPPTAAEPPADGGTGE